MSFFINDNGEIINQKEIATILDDLKIWMHKEGEHFSLGKEEFHYNSHGECIGFGCKIKINCHALSYKGYNDTYHFIWLSEAFEYSLCSVKLHNLYGTTQLPEPLAKNIVPFHVFLA